jgi:RNA polymerase sigma-70 factor (ECF subfamily)
VIERTRLVAPDGATMTTSLERTREALAYADALYNLARYLTGRDGDAEDLVQETYSRALGAMHRLAADSNVKAWLFQILRNLFISQWRRRQNDPVVTGIEDFDAEAGPMPAVEPRDLAAALMTLGADARMAILLDLEGFTEVESAEILGCAVGTVKSRLYRARAALRVRLKEYAP